MGAPIARGPSETPLARLVLPILSGIALLTAALVAVAYHSIVAYLVVAGIGLVAAALAIAIAPVAAVCVAVALCLLPLPARVPFAFTLGGGGTVYLFDVGLVLAAALCLGPLRPTRRAGGLLSLLATFGIIGVSGALLAHPSIGLLGRDLRGPAQLVLGAIIGTSAVGHARLRTSLLRTLSLCLWWGVAVIAGSIATGTNLTFGKVSDAVSVLDGSVRTSYGASRFQLQLNNIAPLILAALIALLILRQVRIGQVLWGFLVPSLFLTFESYSRNNLLALAAACVIAGLLALHRGSVVFSAMRAGAGLILVVLCGVVMYNVFAALSSFLGVTNPLAKEVTAYTARVFGQLSGHSLQNDPSTQWRLLEWHYALASWRRAPLFGHGFGAEYRPLLPYDPFGDSGGTIYVHNWYGWVLAKVGLAGMLILAALFLWPSVRLVRASRDGGSLGAGSTSVLTVLLSALVVSAVAPLMEASSSALFVGVAVGCAWEIYTRRPATEAAQTGDRGRSRRHRRAIESCGALPAQGRFLAASGSTATAAARGSR